MAYFTEHDNQSNILILQTTQSKNSLFKSYVFFINKNLNLQKLPYSLQYNA